MGHSYAAGKHVVTLLESAGKQVAYDKRLDPKYFMHALQECVGTHHRVACLAGKAVS